MSIGIVFSDVDGTIVDNNHHPIPASAEILQRVAAQIPFCLVSARSPEGLYPIHRQLGLTGPIACFSGAYVLDHEGNELYSSVIPTTSPVAILIPLLMASYIPLSRSEIHLNENRVEHAERVEYSLTISTVPSLLPPSTTIYSSSTPFCDRTLSIAVLIVASLL